MKKFLVLYNAPIAEMDKMMESATPEDREKGMEEWMNWATSHKEMVDIGAMLGKNKRVTHDAVVDTRNDIGGFSFIEAESQEAATELLKDSPHFQVPGAYIEVMECVPMR